MPDSMFFQILNGLCNSIEDHQKIAFGVILNNKCLQSILIVIEP